MARSPKSMSRAGRRVPSSPPASEEEPEFALSSGDEDMEPIQRSQVTIMEGDESQLPEGEQGRGLSPPATPARSTPEIARGSSLSARRTPIVNVNRELFIMHKTGRPARFAFDGRVTPDQRKELTKRIKDHGGRIIEDEYECNVFLVPERYLGEGELRFHDSRTVYVKSLGFIHSSIKGNSFLLVNPPPKVLPGQPGGIRSRVPFTAEDKEHLCEYLASVIPNKHEGGRTGNKVYRMLVEQARVEPRKAWALRHSWQSWREHYKKNPETMDPRIDEIAATLEQTDDRKGQFGFVRREYLQVYVDPDVEPEEENQPPVPRRGPVRKKAASEEVTEGDNEEDNVEEEDEDTHFTPIRESPITVANQRNARTHWRQGSVVPLRPMDPERQRSASVARGEQEEEEDDEIVSALPPYRSGRSSMVAPRRSVMPPTDIPRASSSQHIVEQPRKEQSRRAQASSSKYINSDDSDIEIVETQEVNTSPVPASDLQMELPERGMSFADDLPFGTLDNSGPVAHATPRVTRTYARRSRVEDEDITFASSQQTLVNPSQREIIPVPSHREVRHQASSTSRHARHSLPGYPFSALVDNTGSPPRSLTAGPSRHRVVGSQQELHRPSNSASEGEPGLSIVNEEDEMITRSRSVSVEPTDTPATITSRGTNEPILEVGEGPLAQEANMEIDETASQASDADEEDEVAEALETIDTQEQQTASRDSRVEDYDSSSNMFDGASHDSAEFDERTAQRIIIGPGSASSATSRPGSQASSQSSLRGSDNAIQRSNMRASVARHKAVPSSTTQPQVPTTPSRTIQARSSRRRSRSPTPEDEEDEEDEDVFPSPGTRAAAELTKRKREAQFTPGPRAQQHLEATQLRRSKRLKS